MLEFGVIGRQLPQGEWSCHRKWLWSSVFIPFPPWMGKQWPSSGELRICVRSNGLQGLPETRMRKLRMGETERYFWTRGNGRWISWLDWGNGVTMEVCIGSNGKRREEEEIILRAKVRSALGWSEWQLFSAMGTHGEYGIEGCWPHLSVA